LAIAKALVTGGAGFIGSHVVDGLIARGIRVSVVDNLSAGRRENLNPKATLHQVDIGSPQLAEVFRSERPEAVFHLAAQASVAFSVRDPFHDATTNVLGSINLLRQCQEFGVGAIVYSSTGGALYGEPSQTPCPENHPVRPLSPYAASKHAVESYVHCFSALAGFKATILRYANVYGPRQNPEGEAGVVAIFSQRMLEGREMSIFGDGTQERDFVYVGDVVNANMLALDQPGGVFNIGTGTGASVNEVFRNLAALTGYQKQPDYQPKRPGEVYRIYLDSSLARKELGWSPKVSLEEGLRRTVESLRGS